MKKYSRLAFKMVQFAVGLAVVIFSTYCGRAMAKRYKLRKCFFSEMWEFNTQFLTELGYGKRPLQELILSYPTKGEFVWLLSEVLRGRFERKKMPADLSTYAYLTDDEKRFILEYFQVLGKGDAHSQKLYFSQAGNSLQSLKIKAADEYGKKAELYTKLGFLAGLAILIIVV